MFCSCSIHSDSRVFYRCRKVQNIVCRSNNIPFYKSSFSVKIYLVKYWVFSVINRLGIINGKIVKIVCIWPVDRTVILPQLIIYCLVENDREEKFPGLSRHPVTGILIEWRRILQRDFLIIAYVH